MDRAWARIGALFFPAAQIKAAIGAVALCCAAGAWAQTASVDPDAPDMKVLSPGKVDMVDGHLSNDTTDLTIGPSGDGLDFVRVNRRHPVKPWQSNWHFELKDKPNGGINYYTIENSAVGKTWMELDPTDFAQISLTLDGMTKLELLGSGTGQYFKYTGSDGTTIQFEPGTADIFAQTLTRPDGLVVQFQYDTGGTSGAERLRRVYDNRGYVLILEYNAPGNVDAISKVCAINAASTPPPVANTCPAGARSVSYTYSGNNVTSVTDAAGKVMSIALTVDATDGHPITQAFTKPGMSQPYLSVTYGTITNNAEDRVSQEVFGDGATYSYDYQPYGTDFPNVEIRGAGWSEASGLDGGSLTWGIIQNHPDQKPAVTPMPLSVSAAGMTINYTLNPQWTAITDKQLPSGLTSHYTHLGNNSVTEVRSIPPSGSTDPQIATSYTYNCINDVVCFKPVTKTDPRGNVTNYTYDPVHGGMLTETDPAPTAGAVRPQKRYTYQQFYAQYYNSSGIVVQAPSPIWKLTQISECQTTASCAGMADEVRTTITYPSGTGAFNLIPASKTVAAGDNSVSATTSWTYDSDGDKLTEDGPLAGTADTSRWRYDVMRRVIGVVGPDPDGAGALKNRAVRNTYDDAGRLTMVEHGTVNSQSDADWAAFVPLERQTNSYDLQDRVTKTVESGFNGSAFVDEGVTQMSYDVIGRLVCKAVRMDPAQWGSQTDACTPQTTGPNGPDRITKNTYNAQNLITKTEVAYGTALSAPEVTNSWTADGKLATVTDGENNMTTYEYDGLDRLIKSRLPLQTKGALASSTTDFEQLTYDLTSNVTAKRLRDGTTIGYTYDNLNRVTLKDLPGSDPDVTYAYDNLDRMTSASQTGNSLGFTYDALGRQLSETGSFGTVTSAFDAEGRRTTLTYPGGVLTLNYDYLTTGELQDIRENGAASGLGVLATYVYDDLGRRTWFIRGNGADTSYTYDPVSRLTSLANDLAGTSYDLTINGFGYNPANQVTGYTRSNDVYAWNGSVAVNRGYNSNGLNQYSSAGAATFSYDLRGNLTSDGSTTYAYDSENKLIAASGAVAGSMSYDPQQRLYQVGSATTNTRFLYDGVDAIGEYDANGNVLRRYVHGPEDDDPIVQYEGSGLTNRRWLHTDEHGSIVAASDSAGNMLNINSYDEYGIPAASNSGRFQYTGQMWIPELGLYHYKARAYSPTLGRFLQTDPTGYQDGPNWYEYAHDDPIDGSDPAGTDSSGTPSLEELNMGFAMAGEQLVADVALVGVLLPPQPPPSLNVKLKNKSTLTDQQIANITFNETRSLKGKNADKARSNVAHAIINGDERFGRKRPITASTTARVPTSERSTYQSAVDAVARARAEERAGIDPTQGATHFNLRSNDSTRPFQGSRMTTQEGPLDNSFPTKALPAQNIYVNTYGGPPR
jgi:RHS repeat-associated protein